MPHRLKTRPIFIAPGLPSGNWGRMLRLYELQPDAGLPTKVFREALMEQARLIYAPTKVSRLEAVYALRMPLHSAISTSPQI